jgi:hypothetical protein
MRHPKRFLLRFLRATMDASRTFHLAPALARVTETLTWRKEHGVTALREALERGEFPPGYEEYRTVVRPRMRWTDKQTGQLVHFERFGHFVSTCKQEVYAKEDWEKFFICDLESVLLALEEESDRRGVEVSTYVTISCCEGASLFSLPAKTPMLAGAMRLGGLHYPEIAGQAYFFNVSWGLSKPLGIILALAPQASKGKVVVQSGFPVEKLEKALSEVRSELPKEFGGNSLAVLGKCASKI